MPDTNFSHTFTLPTVDLRALIARTKFAISTDMAKFLLRGVYFHAAQSDGFDVLRAVATDEYRLACVDAPLPDGARGMPGVIIPHVTVAELYKSLPTGRGHTVTISLSKSEIQFKSGEDIITARPLNGIFPDYQRVIQADNDKILKVDAEPFTHAVKRLAKYPRGKPRALKVALDRGRVVLSLHTPKIDSAVEELDVSYDSAPLDVVINSRYLLDTLRQIRGPIVHFALSTATAPVVVRGASDTSALYLVMPMRGPRAKQGAR